MIRRAMAIATIVVIGAFATNPVRASDGKLDENGCHYERGRGNYHCHEDRGPNPDRFAPVKKTRENVCIDKRNANYRITTRFVAYRDMSACIRSGGVESLDDSGGLRNTPWPNP
jgi:hypothetical protein